MRRSARVLASVSAAGLALAGPVQAGVAHASSGPTFTILASGLDNPRGLAWSHDRLYLAQAGHGGTDCPPGALGPDGGPLCVGRTGSVSIVTHGHAQPVVSGLISMSDSPGGAGAVGAAALSTTKTGVRLVLNESVLGAHASLAKGTAFSAADSAAARKELGRVADVTAHHLTMRADVGDADYTWSAVNQDVDVEFPDADPNDLVVSGSTTYVVDAASNTLDQVNTDGSSAVLAYFGNVGSTDAVPTCVAEGPDHDIYVGLLAPGAKPGGGKVYRWSPTKHKLALWHNGFNPINGCGFDSHGNFYAVEFQAHGFNPGPTGDPSGDIVKISPKGKRTVIGAGKLFFPLGFAADQHGNIYVSNWSILPSAPSAAGAPPRRGRQDQAVNPALVRGLACHGAMTAPPVRWGPFAGPC